jgi:hypothetical protein
VPRHNLSLADGRRGWRRALHDLDQPIRGVAIGHQHLAFDCEHPKVMRRLANTDTYGALRCGMGMTAVISDVFMRSYGSRAEGPQTLSQEVARRKQQ